MVDQSELNAGTGICLPEAQLMLRPSAEALRLGGGLDVMQTAMSALHQCNRHDVDHGYLAAALPEMGTGLRPGPHGGLRCGTEMVAIGSQSALEVMLSQPGIRRMVARGYVDPLEIDEIFVEHGEACASWYRDRRPEKRTPSAQRRMEARRQKRAQLRAEQGIEVEQSQISQKPFSFESFDGTYASLKIGKVTTLVGMSKGIWTGEEIRVSTYGLSSRQTASVLPVAIADVATELSDAA